MLLASCKTTKPAKPISFAKLFIFYLFLTTSFTLSGKLVSILTMAAVPGFAKTAHLKMRYKEVAMHWLLLVASGIAEAVWAISLGKSDGFSNLVPTIVFVTFYILSVVGLGFALKAIPTGTGYAVWVGIGATLTIIYSMATGSENISLIKVVLLMGLVGCIAGLHLVSSA